MDPRAPLLGYSTGAPASVFSVVRSFLVTQFVTMIPARGANDGAQLVVEVYGSGKRTPRSIQGYADYRRRPVGQQCNVWRAVSCVDTAVTKPAVLRTMS